MKVAKPQKGSVLQAITGILMGVGRMRSTSRTWLTIAMALAVNIASFATLVANFGAGVYPANGDVILIPIFDNAIWSAVIGGLLVLSARCCRGGIAGKGIGVLCGLAAVLLAASCSRHWAGPDHYPIAVAFAGFALMCSLFLCLSVCEWFFPKLRTPGASPGCAR